jgi:hypothetical protein
MLYYRRFNKTVNAIAALAVLVVAFSLIGCKKEEPEELPFEFNMTAKIDNFPEDTVETVGLTPPAYNEDYVARAAKRAGISGKVEQVSDIYNIRVRGAFYSVDPMTGVESYTNYAAAEWDGLDAPKIPSEEKAIDMAAKYIVERGPENTSRTDALMPVQVDETLRSAAESSEGSKEGKVVVEAQVMSRTVVFAKHYQGTPTFGGPGTLVSVTFGDGGEVLGYDANWFPKGGAGIGPVKVLRGDAALAALKGNLVRFNEVAEKDDKLKAVTIDNMKAGYVSVRVDGRYVLVPAFYFGGEVETESGELFPLSEIAMAAPELEDKVEIGFDIPAPKKPEYIKEKPRKE